MRLPYDHVQRSPLGPAFALLAAVAAGLAALRSEVQGIFALALVAVVFALVAANFMHLRVRERDEHLDVRFGPLGWMGTKVEYADVREVRVARSTVLDGWGMHWSPRRGWIFNLWGLDCVEVELGKRRLRIGTDDPRGLARHLTERAGLADSARGR